MDSLVKLYKLQRGDIFTLGGRLGRFMLLHNIGIYTLHSEVIHKWNKKDLLFVQIEKI